MTGSSGGPPDSFFQELKRRHVVRVLAVYVAVALGVIEAASLIFEPLHLPSWALTLVVVLAILGAPVAAVLAWAYELTPEGLVRAEALEGFPEGRARSPRKLSGVIAIGALVLVAVLTALMFWPGDHGTELVARRVLIAPFENRTGDASLDPLGSMAATWITQGLTEGGLVDVVDATTAFPSSLRDSAQGAPSVHDLARKLGAGTVVWGAYYLLGDSIQFQTQVLDEASQEVVRSIPAVTGPADRPGDAVRFLGQRVTTALAAAFDQRLAAWASPSLYTGVPPTMEAYGEYQDGIEATARHDFAAAVEHFERAYAADPGFGLAMSWAAISAINGGEYAVADSLVDVAEAHPDSFSTVDRLWLRWDRAQLDGDLDRELEAVTRITQMAPNNELAELCVGFGALATARPGEVLRAYAHIDQNGLNGQWTTFWYTYAQAHHLLGEYRQELGVARGARRHLRDPVRGLLREAVALATLDRGAELDAVVDSALVLPPTSTSVPATVAVQAALEQQVHDLSDRGQALYRRALEWIDAQDEAFRKEARARSLRARLLYRLGRLDEAAGAWSSLERDDPDNVTYRGWLGVVAARLGDRATAERWASELEHDQRRYQFGRPQKWRAEIAAALGDKDRAVGLLREARDAGYSFGYLHPDPELLPLRGTPAFDELVRLKE